MSKIREPHQFAFFIEQLFDDSHIMINDPILYHRIVRVLKCSIGSSITLFNMQQHSQAVLINYTKKECFFSLISIANNHILKPCITLGLPLLKGNDLDEAISFATQVGVSAIQLLLTDYGQRSMVFANEQKRLFRLIIATTEQSKRFAMPTIAAPINFADIKKRYVEEVLLFGSKDGMDIKQLLNQSFIEDKKKSFFFIVGPEADFSNNEFSLLQQWNAQAVCFGPTVLRSCTAAGIGVGLIRALTYSK